MGSMIEVAAKMTQDAAEQLAKNFRAMPEDKQTWKPLDNGRTALDQIHECAMINDWTAQMINDRAIPNLAEDSMDKLRKECDTADKATARLESDTKSLIAAMNAFPAEHLSDTVTLPWDPKPKSLAEMMLIGYWNMTYHLGQLCYIQTLYGDSEYHV